MAETTKENNAEAELGFADLPDELLALALASGLTEPKDLALVASTSRRLRHVCRQAPLRLALRDRSGDPALTRCARQQQQASLRALCNSFSGTAELCLRDLPIEDADVEHAVQSLPALAALHLTGCKKLTPAVVGALPAGAALRSLFMQRCFQMRSDALTHLLCAASRPASHLSCLALSHISMVGWAPACRPSPNLRLLALHNCTHLSAAGLQAIATACPQLEALYLGGCSLSLADSPHTREGDSTCCGGSIRREMRLAAENLAFRGACYTGAYSSWLQDSAVELAVAACRLPRLRVLEITFCAPGLATVLQQLLDLPPVADGRRVAVQVWDLCTLASVRQAEAWRAEVQRTAMAGSADAAAVLPSEAASLLQAAVCCSSAARQTPLHAAAEDGSVAQVEALLRLGAEVAARDRSGAAALFTACEAGHAEKARRLLAAGADVTQRNSAGEAPLYIAALRGHEDVVEALLEHFSAAGVDWQQPQLYGDGWTPLHAAAVGGRCSVVAKLLSAAGGRAAELVHAANRYGQTALHVAARKGAPPLLKALIEAGGASSLQDADCDGRTAAEVARRNGNAAVWRMLLTGQFRLEQQRLRGTTATVAKPRRAPQERPQGQAKWVGRRLQQRKQQSSRQG